MYILILMMHVGALGDGNSNALTTAEFTTQATCIQAGQAAKKLASGTVKNIEFTCQPK